MIQIHRIEVASQKPEWDAEGRAILHELRDSGLLGVEEVRFVRVYTFAGPISWEEADRIGRDFLSDPVADLYAVNRPVISSIPDLHAVEIRRRPGVMDPVEASVKKGIRELGLEVDWVRTSKKILVRGRIDDATLHHAILDRLANDVIEEVVVGHDIPITPPTSHPYRFVRITVPLLELGEEELLRLSREKQLSLSLPEMKTIQIYFAKQGREPTDIELETLAQTWSEHCCHKTLRGRIRYRDEHGEEVIDNLLKSTIMRATRELHKPWCWSVFADNAGVIDFDGERGAVFKVETHNHPSAIEPYGGAGTGIGGCIRDPLGTGLGAKPVMNTDVFCFAPPDMPRDQIPQGVLHPLRILKGVVAGVRDYGNRMGIPTANGALYFDKRYLANPLVFCGTVAIIPRAFATKRHPRPGQLALAVGGRTGRDGIHGATFSSAELDETSEKVSSGAVQIGNPIEEKKVLDFLLRARDAGLYDAITDCGAGGFSSALGEMGRDCGVEVDLDRAPLKYEGLSYTEIWISEAQERMVIATDEARLPALEVLAAEENVEITPIARFRDDKMLVLRYQGVEVGRLEMDFLHDGIPRIEREAIWSPPHHSEPDLFQNPDEWSSTRWGQTLKRLLASWNICSKEWVIRQYDHEVQGGSVLKPLVGVAHDGPGDATVITPCLGSSRTVVVACGMNPKYSDLDPYWMAASAIDEALRNIVAVGGSIERCALLDNFCWGNCDKPDRLGGLVRAAKACYDIATAYGTPFISGKDSLNNEFSSGSETITIPGTLLISAIAVLEDLSSIVSMDLKEAGNLLYLVGRTREELGGSHFYALHGAIGNRVPKVDPYLGKRVFRGIHEAMGKRLPVAAHDLSEGGLAVALAEMAFAGGLGAQIDLQPIPTDLPHPIRPEPNCIATLLFSESNSRLLLEVPANHAAAIEAILEKTGAPYGRLGKVTEQPRLQIYWGKTLVLDEAIEELKIAWKQPLALG